MRFISKTLVAGAFLLGATGIQAASLHTENNTDLPSTVKVTSGPLSGTCATTIDSSSWTPAHSTHDSSWSKVRALCGFIFSTCSADVYVGENHNCTGKVIGHASLHSDGNVDATTTDSAYELIASQYNVVINQK